MAYCSQAFTFWGGNRVQTAIKTALPYFEYRYNISSPILKFYNLRYQNIKFTCSPFMFILFIQQVKIIGYFQD